MLSFRGKCEHKEHHSPSFSGEIMKPFLSFVLAILFLTLTGCAAPEKIVVKEVKPLSPVPAPATFTGRIPWAGCDGIDITLNFRPDGLYQLRKNVIRGGNRDKSAEMGRWKYDPAENLIVLGEKRGSLKTLALLDDKTLRLQDVEGQMMFSTKLSYDLHKADIIDPFPDPVRMGGMYSLKGDTGFLTECRSGVRFPVSTEKENKILEHSYNTTPHGQGDPLLVSIEGSLIKRDGKEEVVVDRFVKIIPEQDCDGERNDTGLFNTTWRLSELDGKPITMAEGQQNPFVMLEVEGNRMHGFSGCNRFFGTYLVKGEIFVFNKMAGTRMACLKGTALENGFLKAMSKTEAYRIRNGMLELRDRHENILARLKATK